MSNTLRFPSGVTVEQAKKDAKSLSREQQIPLSDAQNEIARRNGLNMLWGRAMIWLQNQTKPLASFRVPLREGYSHIVDIRPEATAVLVLGVTGAGKSVLAQALADQHLGKHKDAELHVFSIVPRPNMTAELPDFAVAEKQCRGIITRNPGRVFHHGFDIHAELPGEGAPVGSVVLIDEFRSHQEMPDRLPKWIQTARERGHILIACAQVPSDLYRDRVPEGLGALFMGRLQYADSSAATDLLVGFLARLQFQRNMYSEFVAVSIVDGWSGIVRTPFPQLPDTAPTGV